MRVIVRRARGGRVRRLGNEAGQSLIEFTLTVPLFLGLLLGLAMMSMIFYSYLTVTLASREGASALVHNPQQTVAQIEDSVRATSISLDRNALTIAVEPSDPTLWLSGVKISVTATYVVPVPRISIPDFRGNQIIIFGPLPVKASSNMTVD